MPQVDQLVGMLKFNQVKSEKAYRTRITSFREKLGIYVIVGVVPDGS